MSSTNNNHPGEDDDVQFVEKEYMCTECGKYFMYKWQLVDHLPVHTTVRPYKCDVCDSWFKRIKDVTIHKKRVHVRPHYICQICQKVLSRKSILDEHIIKIHKQIDQDTVYPRNLIHKDLMKKNMINMKCELCGRGFITRRVYRIHMKSAHNVIILDE